MGVGNTFRKGDFIELDGLPCVVVGVYGDENVPEEHIAVWFGNPETTRIAKGGKGDIVPEVWTIPEEYFKAGQPPAIFH